jgi:hypothetical protein
MPTQREVSPDEPVGAFGNTRVETASRIQEPLPTGPVLNAGPIAALAEVARAIATSTETKDLVEGIVTGVAYWRYLKKE